MSNMNSKQTHRLKVLFINYRQMIEILKGSTQVINIPDYTEILDLTQISSYRRGFNMLITHPSFPEIPEGQEPPTFYAECSTNNKTNRKFHFDGVT